MPFWVGDYKNANIGSYTTANKAVHFLHEKGFLIMRRSGHRKLYEPHPSKSEQDWEAIIKPKKTRSRLKFNPPDMLDNYYEEQGKEYSAMIMMPSLETVTVDPVLGYSNKAIITQLRSIMNTKSDRDIILAWQGVIDQKTCIFCLMNRSQIHPTILDESEVICTKCGLVVHRDKLARGQDQNPSPSLPPR